MKAWLLESMSGLEKLHLTEAKDPKPGPGEVVLEVQYAALNPADRYLAEGQYPAKPNWPHVLGREAAGTILEVAPDVGHLRPGEQQALLRSDIGVNRWGTFAQRVAVPAESLIPIPPGWTMQEAAGGALTYLTAYQALTQWGELPPSVVLITGALGGVGVASVQLAAAMGHTVVALSRSPEKRLKLIRLGAAVALDPQNTQWRNHIQEFLGDRRVDLAIDNIGGSLLPEVIHTLGDHGKVSVVGRLAGPVPQFNTSTLLFRRLRLGGVAVGAYTNAEARFAWQSILGLMDRIRATPQIDRVFAFDQLPAAFARLAAGPMGKVLLAVNGPVQAVA